MARYTLFRRNIEPRCAYCKRSNPLDEMCATCKKHGIVPMTHHCRSFKYDPLRRIPPKPAVLRRTFTDDDFKLWGEDDDV